MLEQRLKPNFAEYLTVGEAAEYLGISPWTLRNWDKAGRLKPMRHPKNGYRIYRHQDLAAVLESAAASAQPPGAGNVDGGAIGEHEHFVQFYEQDDFLITSVAAYLGAGLARGEAAIVVATQAHRAGMESQIAASLPAAGTRGRLIALDAQETLDQLMPDGAIDSQRFATVIGKNIESAAQGPKRVRVFGEMVALLWEQGKRAAAIQLEELWNELLRSHSFSLCCGYPMSAFSQTHEGQSLHDVCKCHSRVMPAESFASLPDADARQRAVAAMQHKARALEAEIAHRQAVEQELVAARQAAEQASKAKDQFLAVLSHELRTPLTPVLMSVTAMQNDPALPARLRDAVTMIRRNLELEARLIDDLLDLSRIIHGKLALRRQRVAIHELAAQVLEMVAEGAAAKNLNVQMNLRATGDCVDGDPTRLHQVLWNLLNNAIKFTPPGGNITLSTGNTGKDHLSIEISDTGAGIDAEALNKIFDAFEQGGQGTKRLFGGLGLGLAISKAIVQVHGGAICAFSDGPGQGATFRVQLPLCNDADKNAPPAAKSDRTAEPQRSINILLVEDHADTLNMMGLLLRREGHTIATAASVAEALRAIEAGGIDLLVSDIGLPDGSGLDLIRQVRALRPSLPAIALTGFGMEQDVRDCEQAGFDAHLTKPIDLEELKRRIAELTQA
jgi:excisionase family DNA binding protein